MKLLFLAPIFFLNAVFGDEPYKSYGEERRGYVSKPEVKPYDSYGDTRGYGNVKQYEGYAGERREGYGAERREGYGGERREGYGGERREGYGGERREGYGGERREGYGGERREGYGGERREGYGREPRDGYGGEPREGYGVEPRYQNNRYASKKHHNKFWQMTNVCTLEYSLRKCLLSCSSIQQFFDEDKIRHCFQVFTDTLCPVGYLDHRSLKQCRIGARADANVVLNSLVRSIGKSIALREQFKRNGIHQDNWSSLTIKLSWEATKFRADCVDNALFYYLNQCNTFADEIECVNKCWTEFDPPKLPAIYRSNCSPKKKDHPRPEGEPEERPEPEGYYRRDSYELITKLDAELHPLPYTVDYKKGYATGPKVCPRSVPHLNELISIGVDVPGLPESLVEFHVADDKLLVKGKPLDPRTKRAEIYEQCKTFYENTKEIFEKTKIRIPNFCVSVDGYSIDLLDLQSRRPLEYTIGEQGCFVPKWYDLKGCTSHVTEWVMKVSCCTSYSAAHYNDRRHIAEPTSEYRASEPSSEYRDDYVFKKQVKLTTEVLRNDPQDPEKDTPTKFLANLRKENFAAIPDTNPLKKLFGLPVPLALLADTTVVADDRPVIIIDSDVAVGLPASEQNNGDIYAIDQGVYPTTKPAKILIDEDEPKPLPKKHKRRTLIHLFNRQCFQSSQLKSTLAICFDGKKQHPEPEPGYDQREGYHPYTDYDRYGKAETYGRNDQGDGYGGGYGAYGKQEGYPRPETYRDRDESGRTYDNAYKVNSGYGRGRSYDARSMLLEATQSSTSVAPFMAAGFAAGMIVVAVAQLLLVRRQSSTDDLELL